MAADDRLIALHVRLRAGSLAALDELAARDGRSRAEVIRDAVGWLIAREARWLDRQAHTARARELDNERRALAAQIAHHNGDGF